MSDLQIHHQWPSTVYPGGGALWLAALGRSCSKPMRTINSSTGRRDRNAFSDGVVCDDSATYSINTASGTAPNRYWQDPSEIYVHSNNGFGLMRLSASREVGSPCRQSNGTHSIPES